MTGVACFLVAYFLLQAGKMKADQLAYPVVNFVGAVLVAISLLWHWNFSAFMLEAAWMLISMYGIVRQLAKRRGASNG